MKEYILGMDLGGTRLKAALLDTDYKVIKTFYCNEGVEEKDTRDMNRDEWKSLILNYLHKIQDSMGIEPVSFGISIPGIPNKENTQILHMPKRLTDVQRLDWSVLTGFPKQIYIINDAKAAFIAELNTDDLHGVKNAFMLTLGTGVGGAAMVDGHILNGAIGRAGHLGHISVDSRGPQAISNIPGGLDYLIGNYSVGERTGGLFSDTIDLERAFSKGDTLAVDFWSSMVKSLAVGIASLMNVLDPEIVILGGGIANAGDRLLKPLQDYLDCYEWRPFGNPIPIITARKGDFSGAIGAAVFAYEKGE